MQSGTSQDLLRHMSYTMLYVFQVLWEADSETEISMQDCCQG